MHNTRGLVSHASKRHSPHVELLCALQAERVHFVARVDGSDGYLAFVRRHVLLQQGVVDPQDFGWLVIIILFVAEQEIIPMHMRAQASGACVDVCERE